MHPFLLHTGTDASKTETEVESDEIGEEKAGKTETGVKTYEGNHRVDKGRTGGEIEDEEEDNEVGEKREDDETEDGAEGAEVDKGTNDSEKEEEDIEIEEVINSGKREKER